MHFQIIDIRYDPESVIHWNIGRYIYFYYESNLSTPQVLTLITNNG